MNKETFKRLNYQTKTTTVGFEEISISIDPGFMIGDYAKAYESELYRRNPVRAQSVGLTAEELQEYFTQLIVARVASINGKLKDWRQLKALHIPAWIEFVMTCVGEVVDTDRGLCIRPVIEGDYDVVRMLEISNKLRAFVPDGLVLLRDAFPRTPDGDKETMTMAILNNYVCAMDKTAHPIASYVAAYLGFKLKEETAFKMLYRVRYDDVDYIAHMLMVEEVLF